MNTNPRQMTADTLNALKGWPNPYAVDYEAEFDASLASTRVPAGSVVHLTAGGKYLLGVGNLNVMPLFTFNNSNDPDVVNYGGNPATDRRAWVPFGPTGMAMALPACGAYELVTTQYVTGQSYVPNTPLTSALAGGNAGKVGPGVIGTNMIVGFVSRVGLQDNGYGHQAVAFWPFPVFPGA